MRMVAKLLVLLLHVILCTAYQWQYTCSEGRCLRGPGSGQSLELCRLTCGSYGPLWPRPTGSCVLGSRLVPFSSARVHLDLSRVASPAAHDFLKRASRLWLDRLARTAKSAFDPGVDVTVQVQTRTAANGSMWDQDESYRLNVAYQDSKIAVSVLGETELGARHALETLSQLTGCCSADGALVMLADAAVDDAPVFPHRGLLIDTSRNFVPLEDLERTVDAMGAAKLNVLHWHATDSHSFPLQLPSVPQMASSGAYSAEKVYTPQQVAQLLKFAKQRGVRVLLEIDAPAHAGQGWQWGEEAGVGQLAVCVGKQPWRKFCIQPPCGQLNPANPMLYNVLAYIYRDIKDMWPQNQPFHMGGDEVFFPCWNSTEEIIDYMQSKGLSRTTEDFIKLWGEYQASALSTFDSVHESSSTPIILWSSHLTQPDIIEQYLNKSRYVIQTWVPASDQLPQQLLSKGYDIIVSTKDKLYLDHGFWGSTRYHDWRAVYENRMPVAAARPGLRSGRVLGGEAASWGELVDGQGLDARLWPRAAALGERLWADPAPSYGSKAAEPRLYAFRERLVAQGVRAEAVAPFWCVLNEGACQ